MVQVAEKARAISSALHRLRPLLSDLEKNRAEVVELVNLMNTLIIPRGWVGVDDYGMLHYTYVSKPNSPIIGRNGPLELSHAAEYVWDYTPWDGMIRCVKTRNGEFKGTRRLCKPPVPCGKFGP